jgi:SP family general alpha glucoside:H+ symporter-like MFS transporter
MSDAALKDPTTGVIIADNEKLAHILNAAVIHDGAKADHAEHVMTLKEAFRIHKKAIFWSMALSGALIMEGYDVVVIGSYLGQG